MSFFEFYQLAESWNIDMSDLRKAYLAKSREVHPDLLMEIDGNESIESTSINNLAYETLKDPMRRIQYILELNGIPTDAQSATLSKEFLMEMMDINELIEDSRDNKELKDRASEAIEEFEQSLNADYEEALKSYNGQSDSKDVLLLNLREYMQKKNYLNRLSTFLNDEEVI